MAGEKLPLPYFQRADEKMLLEYLQLADELQKDEPLVAYYCRLHAMELGLNIPQNSRSKTMNTFLTSLENQLEKDTVELRPCDFLHLERYAENVFARADKQDHAGRTDLSTLRMFDAACLVFEIRNQFGELPHHLKQKRNYAVCKAKDIRKALTERRKPSPGLPGGESHATSAVSGENEHMKLLLLEYLQCAKTLQKHKPLVAYHCRLYAMKLGSEIPQGSRTKAMNALLTSLENQLEKDKKTVELGPADYLRLEMCASDMFSKAEKQDRAGQADLNTAKRFYAASLIWKMSRCAFKPSQGYAAWKAGDIRKSLKEGRKPVPTPPGGEEVSVPSSKQKRKVWKLEVRTEGGRHVRWRFYREVLRRRKRSGTRNMSERRDILEYYERWQSYCAEEVRLEEDMNGCRSNGGKYRLQDLENAASYLANKILTTATCSIILTRKWEQEHANDLIVDDKRIRILPILEKDMENRQEVDPDYWERGRY